MLAQYHPQVRTDHKVRRYLDILSARYVVPALPPWFEDLAKRQY